MKRSFAITTLAVAVLALIVIAGCRTPEPPAEKPTVTEQPPAAQPPTQPGAAAGPSDVGQRAPDFTVTDINGVTRSLGDYGGKILVLDFWATYCKPCVKKLREYESFYAANRDQGLEFLALSMDSNDQVIKGWRARNDGQIPLAKLDARTREAYFGQTALVAIPQVRIVDRRGVIRYSFGPEATLEEIEAAIKTLLEEKR